MGVDGRWVPLPRSGPPGWGWFARCRGGSGIGFPGGRRSVGCAVPYGAQFRRLGLSLCRMVTVFVYAGGLQFGSSRWLVLLLVWVTGFGCSGNRESCCFGSAQ